MTQTVTQPPKPVEPNVHPTPPSATAVQPGPAVARETATASKNQDELEKVRELILGPDTLQQRFGKAEVDRLREIIFGTHLQEYDRRFADLKREMERVLNDLRQVQETVNDFEKAQTRRLETMEREMLRADDDLRREINRLRAQEALVQQLITQARQQELLNQNTADNTKELGKGLGQQERDLRTLKTTVEEHREQNERKLDLLKREARQNIDDLRVELRHLVDRLDDHKTDRKALASMLVEIATRLETGSHVSGLLGELSVPARE